MNNLTLEDSKKLVFNKLKKLKSAPQIAIITGSGIKLFGDKEPLFEINYSELHKQRDAINRVSTKQEIKGHEGKLKLYKINNKGILVFSGRKHLYQGFSILDVTANIRLCHRLQIKKIIITNAAGGINKDFKPGDLMLITGFIDLMQATERGVLSGITQPYHRIQNKLTESITNKFKKGLRKGVYAGVIGPSYETFAEIKLLQSLKASAVGMSTVPEMICAKGFGIDYAGISLITNVWDPKHKPSHKEVLEQAKKANDRLNDLILELVKKV